MPFADISDNISLHYDLVGLSGSPLLLISGFGTAMVDWPPPFLTTLRETHRLILVNNRGMGRSSGPMDNYSMAAGVADIVGLLDFLAIDRVHIFGHSMGGMIGLHLALGYPQRLRSLTLASTAPGGPANPNLVAPTPEVLAQFGRPPSSDRAQDVRDYWPIVYTPAFIKQERDLLESMLATKLAHPEPSLEAHQGQMVALTQTHDVYDRLAEIGCPTLIQTGAEDILVPPQNSRIMVQHIPDARLIEYPSCAHGVVIESHGAVARDLLAFLAEVDAFFGLT